MTVSNSNDCYQFSLYSNLFSIAGRTIVEARRSLAFVQVSHENRSTIIDLSAEQSTEGFRFSPDFKCPVYLFKPRLLGITKLMLIQESPNQ